MYDINRKRLIKTFVDLAKIPSPSWMEQKVRDYVIESLKPVRPTVRIYPCGDSSNLLITVKGALKRMPVLFSAHMDTVTPCDGIRPALTGTKITSDGTTVLGGDDKAAIAMFLESLRFIHETGMPHGPIEVLLSCAEEAGLQGARSFDMSVLKSRRAFVFDSDGAIGKIILRAPYHSTMKITITGKAAHAGMEPEKGINAINVISKIITRLPSGRIDHETTVNVGTITGGRATNIVAEDASCVLEARSIDRNKLAVCEAGIRDAARKTAREFGARCSISRSLEYTGFSINPRDPIVKIAAGAMTRIGIRHHFAISGGGSDTNIFNRARIKAINMSAGMRKVHTTGEFLMIKDLVDGTRLVLSIIDSIR